MKYFQTFFITLALCFFTQLAFANTKNIDFIYIYSKQFGLDTFSEHSLFIKQKNGKFYRNRKVVKKKLIENLIKELEPVSKLKLSNFDINYEWLKANTEKARPNWWGYNSQSQKALFEKNFNDINLIKKLFPRLFSCYWSDDAPFLNIQIEYKDKSNIFIFSRSQCQFMLPFVIKRNGEENKTYNPRLSRAITALFPKKFTNKERLNGDKFIAQLGESVYREIKEDLKNLQPQKEKSSK